MSSINVRGRLLRSCVCHYDVTSSSSSSELAREKIMRRKIFVNRNYFLCCELCVCEYLCLCCISGEHENIKHWFFSSLSCSAEEVNFFLLLEYVCGAQLTSPSSVMLVYFVFYAWPNFAAILCECVLKKISFSSKCSAIEILLIKLRDSMRKLF
jgi:hypothetical protein